MGYLIFLLTLGLVVGVIVMFSKQQEALSKRQKITLALCFGLLFALIAIYNLWQDKTDSDNAALQSAYVQNKPIACEFGEQSYTITKQSFNFSGGTMSFLGKPDSEFNGLIIPLQHCHIKHDESKNSESSTQPKAAKDPQAPQSLTAQDILGETSSEGLDSEKSKSSESSAINPSISESSSPTSSSPTSHAPAQTLQHRDIQNTPTQQSN